MLAYKHGLAQAPAWVSVLEMAEEWRISPWELTGEGEEVLWFLRWQARCEARIAADRERRND